MKIVVYILMILALASIIFNTTKLDFNNLFNGDSQIGVISILAALCVFILLAILQVSMKIKEKQEKR